MNDSARRLVSLAVGSCLISLKSSPRQSHLLQAFRGICKFFIETSSWKDGQAHLDAEKSNMFAVLIQPLLAETGPDKKEAEFSMATVFKPAQPQNCLAFLTSLRNMFKTKGVETLCSLVVGFNQSLVSSSPDFLAEGSVKGGVLPFHVDPSDVNAAFTDEENLACLKRMSEFERDTASELNLRSSIASWGQQQLLREVQLSTLFETFQTKIARAIVKWSSEVLQGCAPAQSYMYAISKKPTAKAKTIGEEHIVNEEVVMLLVDLVKLVDKMDNIVKCRTFGEQELPAFIGGGEERADYKDLASASLQNITSSLLLRWSAALSAGVSAAKTKMPKGDWFQNAVQVMNQDYIKTDLLGNPNHIAMAPTLASCNGVFQVTQSSAISCVW